MTYPKIITGMTWNIDFTVFGQRLQFSPIKLLIHVPAHFLLGLIPSLLGFLMFGSPWVGFVIGSTVGLSVEGFQIIHILPGIPKWKSLILMSVLDILEYVSGAAVILFILVGA